MGRVPSPMSVENTKVNEHRDYYLAWKYKLNILQHQIEIWHIGQYSNNKRHGVGKETDSEGNTFEGRFENGDFVHGRVFYENDDIYIGEYKDDAKNGKGKLIRFEDGAEFEGEWVDDVFQG